VVLGLVQSPVPQLGVVLGLVQLIAELQNSYSTGFPLQRLAIGQGISSVEQCIGCND
jgi:hypothetical protein